MNRSFTILEVMLAITILTIAVGGSYALIQQTLIASSISQSRLIAAYLGQEGVELVRNIRDSNWLEQRTNPFAAWDEGLDGCHLPYCCEMDYQSELTNPSSCDYDNLNYLNVDGDNIYSYNPGTQTNFKRKITITELPELPENGLEVSVEVQWMNRGTVYSMDPVMEHLYNWY